MSSSERSVSIRGDVVRSAIVTGDHSTVSVGRPVQPKGDIDIARELVALREILDGLEMPAKERRKIDNALDEAAEEAAEKEPDRDEVGKALDRAVSTVEKVGKLSEAIGRLRPHLERAAAWLGEHATPLLLQLGV